MAKNWYKKTMPTVAKIKPFLPEMAKTIKTLNGVKNVLAWGSLVNNIYKPGFILKDIDLIAVTKFFSEDLLSINDSSFSMAAQELKDEGFDPGAIEFTKQYIALQKYNIDHWAVSSDNKLLHWGAIPLLGDEWDEIKAEAEKYAIFVTGLDRKKLIKANQKAKDRWSVLHDYYINKSLSGMPRGWYK